VLAACPSGQEGFVRFAYSVWQSTPNKAPIDLSCVDAGIERVRVDLLSEGLSVGAAEVVCDAFGNGDGQTSLSELGEFLAGFGASSFDEVRVSLLDTGDNLVPFGLRLDGTDSAPAMQQTIALNSSVSLLPGQAVNLQFNGEPGLQLADELQILLP
jgi:hypothetical protein